MTPRSLQQRRKVARENLLSFPPPVLVQQFARPPPIGGSRHDANDVVPLKGKLLRGLGRVVVEGFHVEEDRTAVLGVLARWCGGCWLTG